MTIVAPQPGCACEQCTALRARGDVQVGDRVTDRWHPNSLGTVTQVDGDGNAYVAYRSDGLGQRESFGWCRTYTLTVWRSA